MGEPVQLRRAVGWISVVAGAVGLAWGVASFVLLGAQSSVWAAPLLLILYVLGSALPLAFLLVGWRLAHPRPEPPATPRDVTPVPVVPEGEAAALRVPIDACPECGFLGIRMPTIHDGLWPGGGETGARMVCPRCDWQGLPASFATTEDYAEFTRELNASRGGSSA